MSAPKKTPWFDGSVKPVRDGVYERVMYGDIYFAKFSSGFWHLASKGPNIAANQHAISAYQNFPWRGLAKKP